MMNDDKKKQKKLDNHKERITFAELNLVYTKQYSSIWRYLS